MTATTMSVTGAPTAPALDRLADVLLLAFVAALQLSIAVASVLLGAVLLCWGVLLVRDRTWPAAPPFFLALAAYAALTLGSSLFSLNATESFIDSKQLVLFLIVPAVYHIARGARAATVVDVIVTVGAASAAVGIVQYGMLQYDNLGQRPDGTLSHYMTYSGVLMLVICAAVARLVFGGRDRTWPALVMPALVVALSLTLGRSAWVGTCIAVGLLFVLKDFRLTGLLPVVIALIFAFAPDSVTNRMMSVFDLKDPTRLDRVEMARVGTRIIGDYPLTGVGPNMVPRVYPEYVNGGPSKPHLHNVPLQIAAERGLPALAAWLWFVIAAGLALTRQFRTTAERVLPATALAALAAMLGAGLFEYNFGDSEFLMLLLVLVTLPFAAARTDDPAARRA